MRAIYNSTKLGGFGSIGVHSWNVTYNATGYNWLDATDNLSITATSVPEFSKLALAAAMLISLGAAAMIRRIG